MKNKATASMNSFEPVFGKNSLPDTSQPSFSPQRPTRNGALFFSAALAIIAFVLIFIISFYGFGTVNLTTIVLAFLAAILLPQTIHIAMEWERYVICRFGMYSRVAGPGLVFMIPLVEQAACRIDMRTIATPFNAEMTLTSDLVPVDIDAVLFWMVWDANKACMEVENYCSAVLFTAQTAMRDAIGRMSVAEVAISREQLDKELQEIIKQECEPWGIAVLSVKVRDIIIPEELQEAMSLEAQAEREKNARIVLASAEQEISEMLASSAHVYDESESSLKVRVMHLLYESIKQSGGTIVTLPSALSDGIGDKLSK